MDKELITITPADKIDDCMELMSTKKIRHLPVIDNQIVVGIISMGDVVKAIIEIQKTTIEHLDSYISQ
jgi:CBS domain-containing protein